VGVEDVYPKIYRGIDLIEFLKRRAAKRKRPCGAGRLFCFKCKEPKPPAFGEVEFEPRSSAGGRLIGLCPDCTSTMHRRTSQAKLHEAVGNLKVAMKCADSRLGGTPDAHGNPHFERP
jgi:hypothetical protein